MGRWSTFYVWAVFAALVAVAVFQLAGDRSARAASAVAIEVALPPDAVDGPIQPIPPRDTRLDPRRVALGRRLFHEVRLSHDNHISCASCHALDHGGVDGLRRSTGIDGQVGPINAPTVLNAGFNLAQFWDGRAATLEDQAAGPVHNSLEMGSDWNEVIAKLRADASYVRAFAQIYSDGIRAERIVDAIATFERTLTTPNSRFDRYLRGDSNAIDADELAGYRIFGSIGCITCHQGVNVGGNSFQRMGQMADYFADRGHLTDADNGRYNVTHRDEDRYHFRVPSLRNVALTAPYFHDGTAATLPDAVRTMARYQLGQTLTDQQVERVAAFLRTLTGEQPGATP